MSQRDPFHSAPASAAYVARPAVDTALASLLESVHSGQHPVALVGPAGVGKTFLLQLSAERCQADFECVRVPVPSLTADELFGWVRARRGLPIVASPREQLVGGRWAVLGGDQVSTHLVAQGDLKSSQLRRVEICALP